MLDQLPSKLNQQHSPPNCWHSHRFLPVILPVTKRALTITPEIYNLSIVVTLIVDGIKRKLGCYTLFIDLRRRRRQLIDDVRPVAGMRRLGYFEYNLWPFSSSSQQTDTYKSCYIFSDRAVGSGKDIKLKRRPRTRTTASAATTTAAGQYNIR